MMSFKLERFSKNVKGVEATRRFSFCYGHNLPNHKGKCRRWHGHNAILEVTLIRDAPDESTYPGMVMDFGDLKKLMEPILEAIDHHDLNEICDFFMDVDKPLFHEDFPPTAENMVRFLFVRISEALRDVGSKAILKRLRLSETDSCWVTYEG